MKKILLLFLFFGYIGFGQTKGISYQALILDPINQELPGVEDNKAPLADKNICLKFAIIDEFNTIEYEEIFTTKTDNYGMVNLIIGTETKTGGYASSFEDIKWSTLPKNLKIDLSVDPSCSNFSEISNAPFTAVPFALFAINSQNMPGTTGAVMLSGDQAVAGIKTFSDPIFGNLTGDVTGNISGNAVTVSNGVYTTSSVTALSDVTAVGSGAIITDVERTKLDGIEAAADVTDATNVAAAGAVMDSEVTDLAGIKAVTVSTLQVKPSEGAFTDGDKTKLDGIEAAADVTDATNVTAAGAVMDSGNQTVAGTKTFSSSIIGDLTGDVTGNAATATKIASITNSNIVQLAATQTLTNKTLTSPTITGTGAIAGTFTGDLTGDVTGDVTGNISGNAVTVTNGVYTTSSVTALSDVSTVGSGAIITDAERTKLDGIEAAADVTDATNVAAAGAVMDSEVTDLAGIKAVTVSTLQVKPSEGAFADGDKTKLDGVEAAADVTDATNVAAAGAVMNTGNETIAGVKTFSSTISGSITGNAATATKIASITNSNIVQLTDTQTLTNKTLTSPTITGTGAIAGTFTGDVIGNVTGNLTGDLNGTINTATTATTQTAGDNSTKVATTEFVNTEIAAGTSATVSSVNNHIQSSTNDSNAVTNGTEYSATASIAAGSRTFNSANSVNTFNAGIDLNSNSIVSITLSQAASVTSGPGTYNIQPVVTNINATNNTFTITTYASGSLLAPNTDFTFNFFVIK